MTSTDPGQGISSKGDYEKNFWQSKKFIAAILYKMTWAILELVCLWIIYTSPDQKLTAFWLILLTTIVVLDGFIQAGFLGGQTWLDKYVRVAEITTSMTGDALDSPAPSKPQNRRQPGAPVIYNPAGENKG